MRQFLLSVFTLLSSAVILRAQSPLACCDVPGWAYVRDIDISNAGNTAALTNFQVLLVVNTQTPVSQGRMNADGSDIRFSATKCGPFLDYWIESGINTASTEIWVEVPLIPANSIERIYMYYGNPAAAPMSSFSSVFTNVMTITGNPTLSGQQNAEWIDIPAGTVITIAAGQTLHFNARKIVFSGTINGDYNGYGPFAGPGAGGNGVGSVGGGGGGYGGRGGSGGGPQGFGGPPYGTATGADIDKGSGGGPSDCSATAAGGGAVSFGNPAWGGGVFRAAVLEINGTVSVRGQDALTAPGPPGPDFCCCGNTSEAEGGGAGGGILLEADYIRGSGTLNAAGGRGGDSDTKEGGGGGGGGRIKFRYASANTFSGVTNVNPGQAGIGPQCCEENGQPGVVGILDLGAYISIYPEKPIRVFPVADFSATNVCAGVPSAFTDLSAISSGSIVAWQWDFGDSQTSAQQHPSHTYAAEGVYTVTLTVSSDSTCTHAVSRQVTVFAAPAVSFTFQNTCDSLPVNFTDQSTVSPPYTIAGWNWDFGDSQVSSLQHPAHIYAAPGAYTVTLTATTSSGCSSTQASSVTVHELPVLTLTPAPATCFGQSNGAITLAVANGLPGYTFIWSNGNTTQHLTGIPAGNYSVTVTDANSCTAAGNATVSQPSAGITITAVDSMSASCFAYNDGYITITATGGNGTLNYNWSNGVYSANNPNLIAGTYEVTVTDANGCSATASYAITEPQQLLLDVTPSDTTVKFGVPLQLTAALSPPDPSATIAWTPERDLSCYDCYAPQMTGTGTVVYTVNATNSAGCPASATATVTVLLDKILYIPNAFSPNGDTHNDDFRVYTFGDKRFKMAIFDRWGGEVFFTEDINQGWNGTIGGKEPVPGVYVYDVFIEYLDRRVERRQGSVVLLR